MQSKRLLKLANFLLNLNPKKFDLNEVIASDIKMQDNPSEILNECGTVGCAVGWCPSVFPKLVGIKYYCSVGPSWGEQNQLYRVFDKKHPDAIEYDRFASVFFGITESEAEYLFYPFAYHKSKRGPKSVANRILNFVKNKGRIRRNTKAFNKGFA